MRDFTLEAYKRYLLAIKGHRTLFLMFREFINCQKEFNNFCLVRHDVDRKPLNALRMANLERELGINATYYFRVKKNVFVPEVMKQIESMGHEVGYHYECLSDSNGNFELATKDFDQNLRLFRKYVTVDTISMHGRPLKPFDNRDLWRNTENHDRLRKEYGILGEIYLDIDYKDIAYISDTGRNWDPHKNNIRDSTNSEVYTSFKGGYELLKYFEHQPPQKLVFQVHPERWENNLLKWTVQYGMDYSINVAKVIYKSLKNTN